MQIVDRLTKRYFDLYSLMEETVPMKDNLLDHFWGFRPKIRG